MTPAMAGCDDARDMNLDERPACLAQYDNRDSAAGKILLVANLLVGCQQQLEARSLRCVEHLPVLKRCPLLFGSRPNPVA